MKTPHTFFQQDHLSEEGIALYVDALKLNRANELPSDVSVHVENCDVCKEQVIGVFELLKDEVYPVDLKHPFFDRSIREPFPLYSSYRIAAVVAGAALLGGGYFYFMNQSPTHTSIKADSQLHAISPIDSQQSQIKNSEILIADNFSESANMKDLMKIEFRSSAIQVLSPSNGETVKQPVIFKWNNNNEPVRIKILTNKEVISTTATVTGSTFTLFKKLTAGLYYWKLETENELLFIGKFIVK